MYEGVPVLEGVVSAGFASPSSIVERSFYTDLLCAARSRGERLPGTPGADSVIVAAIGSHEGRLVSVLLLNSRLVGVSDWMGYGSGDLLY